MYIQMIVFWLCVPRTTSLYAWKIDMEIGIEIKHLNGVWGGKSNGRESSSGYG